MSLYYIIIGSRVNSDISKKLPTSVTVCWAGLALTKYFSFSEIANRMAHKFTL